MKLFVIFEKKLKPLIYLDNNATTRIDDRVLNAMLPFLTDDFANANSTHHFGIRAYEAVKNARLQVCKLINAEPNEIVFTSGATESINIALKGIAESNSLRGKHILTVSTEHSAVLDTCEFLRNKGFEITYLRVENDGTVDIDYFKSELRNDTTLVCVMVANNETGVIHPIKELIDITHQCGALFFTDATQAVGKTLVDVKHLNVDLLCLSGHKIHGPKGIGALYIRQHKNKIKIPALIHGGGHENGMRSGTLNVPGIIGLGTAAEIAQSEFYDNFIKIKELRDYFEREMLKTTGISVNGSTDNRLNNTSNILIEGVDSDAAIMSLSSVDSEFPMIAVSNGSACTSHSIEPSHVLIAMGLEETQAFSSIRFSFSKYNNFDELNIVLKKMNKSIEYLRSMNS